MTTIALISDIHSNLEALQECIKDIRKRGIKKIICAGDIVGYGAQPNECCDIVKKENIISVAGNHDIASASLNFSELFNPISLKAVQWTNKNLTEENKEFLLSLPEVLTSEHMFVCHASPNDHLHEYLEYETDDDYLKKMIAKTKKNILVVGHTHNPFIKRYFDRLVINTGSVGQPRDNNPKLSYCILEAKNIDAEIIRLNYDYKTAAEKIIKAKLPHFFGNRLHEGV